MSVQSKLVAVAVDMHPKMPCFSNTYVNVEARLTHTQLAQPEAHIMTLLSGSLSLCVRVLNIPDDISG